MILYREVESTEKPLEREINGDTYYLRRDIELVPGDEEEGKPDMYHYLEAEVTVSEYIENLESLIPDNSTSDTESESQSVEAASDETSEVD